jgi:hypothetical protein
MHTRKLKGKLPSVSYKRLKDITGYSPFIILVKTHELLQKLFQ